MSRQRSQQLITKKRTERKTWTSRLDFDELPLHFVSSVQSPIFFVGDSTREGDFNPVSANSNHGQFSPNNFHILSTDKF